MSRRQFAVFDNWFWWLTGLHFELDDEWCQRFLSAPIVICPDCDLYVVPREEA